MIKLDWTGFAASLVNSIAHPAADGACQGMLGGEEQGGCLGDFSITTATERSPRGSLHDLLSCVWRAEVHLRVSPEGVIGMKGSAGVGGRVE